MNFYFWIRGKKKKKIKKRGIPSLRRSLFPLPSIPSIPGWRKIAAPKRYLWSETVEKDWLEIHNPSSPRNYIEKGDFTLVAQTPTRIHNVTGDSVFSAICTISRTSVSFAFSYCIHPHPTEASRKESFPKKKVSTSKIRYIRLCVCMHVCMFFFFFFFYLGSISGNSKDSIKIFFVSFRRGI